MRFTGSRRPVSRPVNTVAGFAISPALIQVCVRLVVFMALWAVGALCGLCSDIQRAWRKGVLSFCAYPQVTWIRAFSVSTEMVNAHAVRYRADVNNVRRAMRLVSSEGAVPVAVDRSRPYPAVCAVLWNVDMALKSLRQRQPATKTGVGAELSALRFLTPIGDPARWTHSGVVHGPYFTSHSCGVTYACC